MKRRDFFKGLAGVIVGFAIAPVVVKEIKETPKEWEKALRKVTWVNRGGWNCHNEHIPKLKISTDDISDGWGTK